MAISLLWNTNSKILQGETETGVETLHGSIHYLAKISPQTWQKIFFHLLDKHCPKSNNLYKIFNRNTVKVSYSRIRNMSQIIKRHNKRLTKANRKPLAPWNRRDKNKCQVNEKCKVENVVCKYFLSTTENSKEHVYIGVV